MGKPEFIVQTMDAMITSNSIHEIKEHLDSDFTHLVGIAISDIHCSDKSIINLVKVKGIDILPENFEAAHIITSKNVEPNKKFYTMFQPVIINGDEISVKFTDTEFSATTSDYRLQIFLLLTNNPENINRAAFN